MKLLDAKDQNELAEFLIGSDSKHPRTRRLCDRAQKYIGGMDDAQRTVFLEAALAAAWEHRHSFNAQYATVEMFWERMLQIAARARDRWLISVATLPGVYEKRWVLGHRLGRY